MKRHIVLRNLLIDVICAGLALLIFALFHHVLPRPQQSMGIVINNPYQTDTEDKDESSKLPDNAMMIASAGISDVPMVSAKGGGQSSGG